MARRAAPQRDAAAVAAANAERARKAAETRRRNKEAAAARAAAARRDNRGESRGGDDDDDGDRNFDIPEDDGAALQAGHLRHALANMSATISAQDARFDGLDANIALLLQGLDAGNGGQGPGGQNDNNVPTGGVNALRGQHGECPPVSVRYAYLDEKLRSEAMAGTLPPTKLPQLLPDTSRLSGHTDDGEGMVVHAVDGVAVFTSRKTTAGQSLAKFIRAIPNATVFAAAWGIFTDLVLHGLRAFDSSTVADAHSALRHHELWVLERSLDFTWESICAYHLDVAAERLAAGFRCEAWYKNVDADAWTRHQVRKAVHKAAAPSDSSRRAAATSSAGAGPSLPAICNNFNMGIYVVLLRLTELASAAGLHPPAVPPSGRPNTSPGFPVFDPSDVPACPSPLRPSAWEFLLRDKVIPVRAAVAEASDMRWG
ncbi:hypothetical protein EHS25_008391 [Saitozyma podzolica]|uniref:Uncharacterized protein n=1 Tax=Saitozyma podzolica TaxID=1890683 RepID=A0A427YPF5_9TREE|nr:hypothetical protein EHS25_008391 [Saitozyma podzolica]